MAAGEDRHFFKSFKNTPAMQDFYDEEFDPDNEIEQYATDEEMEAYRKQVAQEDALIMALWIAMGILVFALGILLVKLFL
jgi:hypothetical protein